MNDYGRVAESLENFNKMVEYIREEEEIVSYGIKRMPGYFEKYQKLISAVIKDGKINNKKTSTMDFIEFMEKYNADKSFSDFADGLILRKDIEVNIKDVYKILKSNPT